MCYINHMFRFSAHCLSSFCTNRKQLNAIRTSTELTLNDFERLEVFMPIGPLFVASMSWQPTCFGSWVGLQVPKWPKEKWRLFFLWLRPRTWFPNWDPFPKPKNSCPGALQNSPPVSSTARLHVGAALAPARPPSTVSGAEPGTSGDGSPLWRIDILG